MAQGLLVRWEANCEIIQGGGGMSMAVDGTNA